MSGNVQLGCGKIAQYKSFCVESEQFSTRKYVH